MNELPCLCSILLGHVGLHYYQKQSVRESNRQTIWRILRTIEIYPLWTPSTRELRGPSQLIGRWYSNTKIILITMMWSSDYFELTSYLLVTKPGNAAGQMDLRWEDGVFLLSHYGIVKHKITGYFENTLPDYISKAMNSFLLSLTNDF